MTSKTIIKLPTGYLKQQAKQCRPNKQQFSKTIWRINLFFIYKLVKRCPVFSTVKPSAVTKCIYWSFFKKINRVKVPELLQDGSCAFVIWIYLYVCLLIWFKRWKIKEIFFKFYRIYKILSSNSELLSIKTNPCRTKHKSFILWITCAYKLRVKLVVTTVNVSIVQFASKIIIQPKHRCAPRQ